MDRNSSGLIARTEGLSGEPLLTQWLAHLLEQSKYQTVLISFFLGEAMDNAILRNVTIRPEAAGADGDGRPDIEIGCEELALIVENKFDAGMTKKQPLGYLQILKKRTAEKKTLAFLVPDWRRKEVETILAQHSSKAKGVNIRVCTWEDMGGLLKKSFADSELIREFSQDIQWRCKVQLPLTTNELMRASDVLAASLKQRELLNAIRKRLQVEALFKRMMIVLEAKPVWEKDDCYMGMTLLIASEWVFWIGFWNLLQRKNPKATPLIAHVFHQSKEAQKLFPKFWSSLQQLRARNIVAPLVPGHGWPIPVPVRIMQDKTLREQAENVVAYTVRVLNGDTRVNKDYI